MYVSLEAAPSTIKSHPWCLCHSDPHFGVKDLSCYLYPPRYPQCCPYGQTRPYLNSQNQSLLLVLYPVDVFMIRFYLIDEFTYPG